MILTKEIFEQGKSNRGGWNNKQLKAIGVGADNQIKGWKKAIIGKDFHPSAIEEFLSNKNAHLNGRQAIKKNKRTPIFISCALDIPWKKQYLHPNWQKMRLKILERDKFSCINCGERRETLHVHHLKYSKKRFIWEVPMWYLVTLCEDCHSEEHGRDLRVKA